MRAPKLLVVDASEDFRRQIERAIEALQARPEVVHCDGTDGITAVVEAQGPFDVMIAGPPLSSDQGLLALRRLRLQIPQTSLILAFDKWRSGSLRKTVQTGAVDILRLPVDDEVIQDAVEQAIDVRWAAPVALRAGPGPQDREGTVIVVGSATGGCGKTFFSTNLAYHLQSRFDQRSCLIDLDLQFGELSTALRLKPRHTIADLLAAEDGDKESLAARLEECVMRHETGIYVLAAPEGPAEADTVEAADVTRVIEAAQSQFDYVVIDTPAALSGGVLTAIEHADHIFSMATLDLPSVRNLGVLLSTFDQLKVPAERVHLVLNKVERDVGMDVAGVSRYFPQGFSAVIPYGREVNRSLNMGVPMLAFAPRSDVSKAVTAGLESTMHLQGDASPEKADRRSRFFGRRRQQPA